MGFNKIEKWDREETYNHYMNVVPCTYSMTVNIDITNFLKQVKRKELKFFPTFLYLISVVINRHKEFRMSISESGEVGFYDISHPCYAVFNSETESFSIKCTQFLDDFNQFYDNYINKVESIPENIFNVSLIPWTSFTGFNLNLQKGYDYLAPIFTIGKYFQQEDKILIPLAVQVHHSVCDGFHLCRFINELESLTNDLII